MEERKRTLFALIIACVVVIALLYSFGMNLFSPRPQLVLADPDAVVSHGPGEMDPGSEGGIPVELTTETVQRVIADLVRYTSYSRTVEVNYYWGEDESGFYRTEVYAGIGWVRTDTELPSGMKEHSIVGAGNYWLWYDNDGGVHQGPADRAKVDLMQRIPTYEDVLRIPVEDIIRADYSQRDGEACIFVEARQAETENVVYYWISMGSGLLMGAEVYSGDQLIYRMRSRDMVTPLTGGESYFVLPDGTDLPALYPNQGGA